MKRASNAIESRREFVKMAINQPIEAAAELRRTAETLEQAHGTSEIVAHVSDLLCVSESTIYKDASE